MAVSGCVGGPYHLGNESLFPTGIETVYVPVIESASFRRDLGEQLTEAVIKEIERRTPYKVVGDPRADTILIAKLVGETKHLVVQSRTGDPRESQVNFQLQVSWLDRRGSSVRDLPAVPLPADCLTISGASNLVPEVGQSVATAQQKAIQKVAQQIVSLMETPW